MIASYGANGYVKLDQKQSGSQPAIVYKEEKKIYLFYTKMNGEFL